VVNKLNVKKI